MKTSIPFSSKSNLSSSWSFKLGNTRTRHMVVRKGGAKRAFPWKLRLKSKYFLKMRNQKLNVMAVCLPVWHSHCTRNRFTVLVSCSDELTVHSCPLICLKRQVVKLGNGLL